MAAEPQSAHSVLMIRPARFGANPETAASNAFQSRVAPERPREAASRAVAEFDALAAVLRSVGVEVCVVDDSADPVKPDAIFPNNWVSFHADGTVVLYPMLAPTRRRERRLEVITRLVQEYGFRARRTVDLSAHEENDQFLEGTGSLVLDRINHVAYACLSPRTQLDALGDFAQQLDYEIMSFDACDSNGQALYHTNVMMCVGESFAAICGDSIRDRGQRDAVTLALEKSGHEIVDISLAQMSAFAGNMLELVGADNRKVIAMSQAAADSLTSAQRAQLERHGRIVSSPIPTIECYGGGSVRCMLAEVHLPKK